MKCFDGFPNRLSDALILNANLHIEECQFAMMIGCINGYDSTAHTLAILADGFVGFGTFCL